MVHNSTSITDTRRCTVCHELFTFVRTVGRPREKCSSRCIQVAARRHSINHYRRRSAVRNQLTAQAA